MNRPVLLVGVCIGMVQLRLALLRIGEVAEFAVSRPGGAVTVRAAMAERAAW